MQDRLTWKKLTELEPRLLDLERRARNSAKGQDCYCYERAWFGDSTWGSGFKAEMVKLIGWKRQRDDAAPVIEQLHTPEAYQIAYDTLLRVLPSCHKCSMHNIDDYIEAQDTGDLDGWC